MNKKRRKESKYHCRVCEREDKPTYYHEDCEMCHDCRLKYDIFRNIGNFLYSFKEIVHYLTEKPSKCCVCGKKPVFYDKKFSEFYTCDICKKKSCYYHRERLNIGILKGQMFYSTTALTEFSLDVCKNCLEKSPELIYVYLYKKFGNMLKNTIKELREERSTKRKIKKSTLNNGGEIYGGNK